MRGSMRQAHFQRGVEEPPKPIESWPTPQPRVLMPTRPAQEISAHGVVLSGLLLRHLRLGRCTLRNVFDGDSGQLDAILQRRPIRRPALVSRPRPSSPMFGRFQRHEPAVAKANRRNCIETRRRRRSARGGVVRRQLAPNFGWRSRSVDPVGAIDAEANLYFSARPALQDHGGYPITQSTFLETDASHLAARLGHRCDGRPAGLS